MTERCCYCLQSFPSSLLLWETVVRVRAREREDEREEREREGRKKGNVHAERLPVCVACPWSVLLVHSPSFFRRRMSLKLVSGSVRLPGHASTRLTSTWQSLLLLNSSHRHCHRCCCNSSTRRWRASSSSSSSRTSRPVARSKEIAAFLPSFPLVSLSEAGDSTSFKSCGRV